MATKREKKIKIGEDLASSLKEAKAVILTDYRGLTHHQLEDLRKILKEVKAEYTVIKNTILSKVLEKSNFKPSVNGPDSSFRLDGPTAALIAKDDEMAALAKLTKFMQTANLPQIKLGFLFGSIYSSDDVVKISKLPSKQTLIAQLVAYTKGPLFGLHNALSWNMRKLVYALDSIKNTKS